MISWKSEGIEMLKEKSRVKVKNSSWFGTVVHECGKALFVQMERGGSNFANIPLREGDEYIKSVPLSSYISEDLEEIDEEEFQRMKESPEPESVVVEISAKAERNKRRNKRNRRKKK
jgi:hypothetical protein